LAGQLDLVETNQIKEVGGNLASLVDTVNLVVMVSQEATGNLEVTPSQEDMASKVGTLVALEEYNYSAT
jgi:hypothetical protein